MLHVLPHQESTTCHQSLVALRKNVGVVVNQSMKLRRPHSMERHITNHVGPANCVTSGWIQQLPMTMKVRVEITLGSLQGNHDIFGWECAAQSWKPFPIIDQNIWFSILYSKPDSQNVLYPQFQTLWAMVILATLSKIYSWCPMDFFVL